MKPFFGIDITENKKSEIVNGDEFLVKKPSEEKTAALSAHLEKAVGLVQKSKLPLPLRIAQGVCGLVGFVMAIGILRAMVGEDSVSLSEAYTNAPWLFWLTGAMLVTFSILLFIGKKKEKETMEEGGADKVSVDLDAVVQSIYRELGVPENAAEVDVLSYCYVEKEGKIHVKERGMSLTPYQNMSMVAYVENDALCLVNLDGKYVFPLSDLRAIREIKKHISVPSWNKALSPDSEAFKPYQLTVDGYECVHFKSYYLLELEKDGMAWSIAFPNYERFIFERMTGLQVVEKNN